MIYEYYCKQCDHLFSIIGSITSPPTGGICPKCNKPAHRKFHAPGVVYKTSGFYHTDKVLYDHEDDE